MATIVRTQCNKEMACDLSKVNEALGIDRKRSDSGAEGLMIMDANGGEHRVFPPSSTPSSGVVTPSSSISQRPSRQNSVAEPVNFGVVQNGRISRSGYPSDCNIDHLEALELKSILTLVDSSESEPGYKAFIADHGINHKVLKMTPNKEAKAGKEKKRTSTDSICEAILFVMDRSNQPIHIHCNQGKHRTGCVIACLRKIEGMSVDDALVEYATYAGSKQRLGDIELIKAFDGEVLFKYAMKTGAAARFDAMLHDSHLTLCWNLDRLIDALGMGTRYLKQRAATSKRLHSRYVASVPELSMSVSSMSVGSPSTPSTPSSPMSDDGSQMVPVSARRFSFDLAAATEPALGKRCASVPPRLHLDDVDFVIPVSELRS